MIHRPPSQLEAGVGIIGVEGEIVEVELGPPEAGVSQQPIAPETQFREVGVSPIVMLCRLGHRPSHQML